MKLGIMQPYFFPYLGYISLIKNTDEFMLFDSVQFIHHGWIERNRILKPYNKNIEPIPGENWQYIAVPLKKHSRDTIIKNIEINNSINWREKLINQLNCYKKKAIYYDETLKVVKQGIDIETNSIVKLDENILKSICQYLGIKTRITIFSEENLHILSPTAPDEWALNICLAKGGVDEYWNPPGGITFFSKEKYDEAGIDLRFQQIVIEPYVQKIGYFEPSLSIIDVMMFNSPKKINEMLQNYEFLEKEDMSNKKYLRKK